MTSCDRSTLSRRRQVLATFDDVCILPLGFTTPFCVTGWPIVDNQLNSTFGNRHSLQPIGGIHYWLAYQQKRLDSNWPFCTESTIIVTGKTFRLIFISVRHKAK